jgi:hypothetical protein
MDLTKMAFYSGLTTLSVAAAGCKGFGLDSDLGDSIVGASDDGLEGTEDEFGDSDEEPDPSGTPVSEWPKIPGASWSLTWYTREPIRSADLTSAGLALAGVGDLALIDPSNGLASWSAPELVGDGPSAVWLGDDRLVWARNPSPGKAAWQLRTHALDGELQDTQPLAQVIDTLTFDDAGNLYLRVDEQLLALDPSGAALWSRDASPEHTLAGLSPAGEGVHAIEAKQGDHDLHFIYRLLALDAAGAELSATGYDLLLTMPDELAAADGRVYVTDGFPLAPAHLHAVDPEFAGVAWSLEFPVWTSLRVAPAPDGGGVLLLVAPLEAPAELWRIDASGELLASQPATSVEVLFPILVVGEAGEVIVGGRGSDGVLELNRLE